MTERGQSDSGHLSGVVLPGDELELNSAGVTPLMLACYNGEAGKVREILQTGYQTIQAVNHYNASALDYAVDNHQAQVVDILLGFGADLDALNQDGHGISHRCVLTGELNKVTTCIQIGANLDLRNRNGETALHVAIEKQLDEIVEVLIKNGCDTTATNREGFNAHECAFLNDNLRIQRALSTYPDDTGDTLVSHQFLSACVVGSVTRIESVISSYGEQVVQCCGAQNVTPVYLACLYGHLSALKTLCRYRPNVNMTLDSRDSPLICAARGNYLEIVRCLIMEGARVNFRNERGYTALHGAASKCNTEIVKILVDNGTLVNLKSENGSTALFLATRADSLDIVKYLVEHGVLVDVVNERGITPLLLAVYENNMEITQYLIEHGANVEQCTYDQCTPLMVAVTNNELALVQYLVEHGARIDIRTPAGIPLIEFAQTCDNHEIPRYLTDIHNRLKQSEGHQHDVIFNMSDVTDLQQDLFCMVHKGSGTHDDLKLLIQKGTDLNRMDNTGKTPLITAINYSHPEHVAWLIHEQVNVNLADNSGCPPLIHAVLVDSLVTTELLLACDTVPPLQCYTGGDIPTQSQAGAVIPTVNQTGTIHQRLHIDQTDSTGKTALAYCAESQHKFAYQIAIKLIDYGANVNVVDSTKQAILEKCVKWRKSGFVELLLEKGAQLLPLCPGILFEVCLSSDSQMTSHCIKHLLASDSEMCGPFINLVLSFTAANLNWGCLKTCLREISGSYKKVTNKREVFEILNTETLCQMIKFFSPDMLDKIGQDEDMTTLVIRASEEGEFEVVKVFLERGANPNIRNQHCQDAVGVALDNGQYKMVADLISTNTLDLEIQEEPHKEGLKSLQAKAPESAIDSAVLIFIRNPQPFVRGISRWQPDPALHIHVAELNGDQCEKYVNDLPHIEMYRRELVTAPHLATPLTDTTCDTDQKYSTQWNSVPCLHGYLMCVFKNWSTDAYWALTTADAVQMSPNNDDYVQTSNIPNQVQKMHVIKRHCGLKSVNVAALLIEYIDMLRKGDICLNKVVFHGKDLTLLQRKVTKRVPTQGLCKKVQGVVVDVNVSFQDQHGQFHHGAFVVSSVDQNQVFAECGQSGAAVVDTDSGIVLGLVVAAQCEYLGLYKHVTFCLRLDHALMELNERYNVNIGKFRSLDTDDGYV